MSTVWRGQIRIKRLTIPIGLHSVVDSQYGTHGKFLHEECNTGISRKNWCNTCERQIESQEIIKGYAVDEEKTVTLDSEDLAALEFPNDDKLLTIESFALKPNSLYLEKPYFVQPSGSHALHALTVLRKAMGGKIGLGRLLLRGKLQRVALTVHDKGMVVYTIRPGQSVRSQQAGVESKVEHEDVKLAKRLIANMLADPKWADYPDHYEDRLQAVIANKADGKEFLKEKPERKPVITGTREAIQAALEEIEAA